jgi:hypothetical protein
MRLAMADVGPLQIELIEVGSDNTVYAEHVKAHGYGLHHFGVLVDDMEEAKAKATAAGFKVVQEGGGHGLDGDGGFAYLNTESHLGTTVEFIARPQRRIEPERIYPPEMVDTDK